MDFSQNPDLDFLSEALHPIQEVATSLGLTWVLIGAAARDLILLHEGADPSPRRTLDVDIAISVESWDQFETLRTLLIEAHGARPESSSPQRIHLSRNMPIDIVPFGGITRDGVIRWPPEGDWTLGVAGFADALAHSIQVILPGGLRVQTTSAHHFLALKLMAWRDRHLSHPDRDASDLALVMEHATDFIGLDVLYEDHEDTLKLHDFDPDLAALHILGRKLGSALTTEAYQLVLSTLQAETSESGTLTLVRELQQGSRGLAHLRALENGLQDL